MKKVDLAWAAGLIDGEGCIGIYRRKPRRGCCTFTLHLAVNMTHAPTINRLHRLFACGTIAYYAKKNGFKNRKPTYAWQCAAQQAYKILCKIVPFMVTKKRNALLGIKFQERVMKMTHRHYGKPIPTKEINVRDAIVSKMKTFNKRGLK